MPDDAVDVQHLIQRIADESEVDSVEAHAEPSQLPQLSGLRIVDRAVEVVAVDPKICKVLGRELALDSPPA
jgi:hypothetical protein